MKGSLRRELSRQPCIGCGKSPVDLCHIISRGAGGPDEDFNLYPGCRSCHQVQHRVGIVSFFSMLPRVRRYFEGKGWRLEEIVGRMKLVHEKLEVT